MILGKSFTPQLLSEQQSGGCSWQVLAAQSQQKLDHHRAYSNFCPWCNLHSSFHASRGSDIHSRAQVYHIPASPCSALFSLLCQGGWQLSKEEDAKQIWRSRDSDPISLCASFLHLWNGDNTTLLSLCLVYLDCKFWGVGIASYCVFVQHPVETFALWSYKQQ